MAKRKVQRAYEITGNYHNHKNVHVKPLLKSDIYAIYTQAQMIINQKSNPKALTDLLFEDYIWNDSIPQTHNDGYNTSNWYENDIQSNIEVLFLHYPDLFLNIFYLVKDNDAYFHAFTRALLITDLHIFDNDWDDKTLALVNKNLHDLETQSTQLMRENARSEARVVTELCDTAKNILSPKHTKESKIIDSTPDLKQRIEFAATLHCANKTMSQHRKFWKVVVGNILLGILGAGIFYGLAVACHGNYFFSQTKRKQKLQKIEDAIYPRGCLLRS